MRKEYREVNRLRNSYQRQINFRLISTFSKIGTKANDAFLYNGKQGVEALSSSIRNDVATTLEPFYRQVILAFAKRTFDNRYAQKAIQDYDGIYRQFMRDTGGTRITEISDTTRKIINKTILDNQSAGVAEISKAINEKMSPRFTKGRASTIARTETHTASSFAIQKQAENFEEPNMRKRWIASNDDRSRGTHLAVNGTEVGIDEDFIVGGKRMKYAGDPRGGAKEVINCRCVIAYVEAEDVIVGEDTPTQTTAKPQVITAGTFFDSPLNKSVSESTIKIISAKKGTDILQKQFEEANKDPRYLNRKVNHFRSRRVRDYGFANLKGLDDKAVSMLVAIKPELDALADKFNVPKIRGYKFSNNERSYNANMGDGIMGLQVRFHNNMASNIGKTAPTQAEIANIATIRNSIDELQKTKLEQSKRMSALLTKHNVITFRDIKDKKDLRTAFDLSDLMMLTNRQMQNARLSLQNIGNTKLNTSTWKRGDSLSLRPGSVKQFEDNKLDRFRSTYYHEMGHHVHQMYKLKDARPQRGVRIVGEPDFNEVIRPLEERLKKVKDWKNSSPSNYGATDVKEWFVENFSLYYRGKKDLVDPKFVEILQEILDDKIR